ncbi:MAG: FAD:protein FMN transferase [Saprospiraceae bacterium]|nr:FAD:protein FMN transferase [Saprospiraceae bacterium]
MKADNLYPITIRKPALGTTVSVTCFVVDSLQGIAKVEGAFAVLDSLNKIFSDYDPSSEIMQITSHYQKGEIISVSAPLFDLLQKSIDIRRLTGGAFNVEIGVLSGMWRSFLAKDQIPPRKYIRKYRRKLKKENIRFPDSGQIQLMQSNMRLDFGGIAKGYIGDLMAKHLKEEGVTIFLIDLGGDLIAGEPPPESGGWKITISWCNQIVQIANQSIATSGPDFQFFVHKGRRYAHIIDPQTGWGVENLFGSTVIANSGYEADALASAFSILSMLRSSQLLKRKTDIAAIIGRQNELFESDNFSQYVISDGQTN